MNFVLCSWLCFFPCCLSLTATAGRVPLGIGFEIFFSKMVKMESCDVDTDSLEFQKKKVEEHAIRKLVEGDVW